MEGIVYHGSNVGSLKEIKPNVSTHRKNCVYATEKKIVALLFMAKGNGDLDTMIGTENEELTLVERRPGVLESLYNFKGYLYELSGKTFSHYDYLWSQEVISFNSVPILKVTEIPNILEEIYKEEKLGNIRVFKYPNRPSHIPLDNSDLIEKYIDFEKKGLKGAINKLLEIYPEFENQIDNYLK